MLNVGVSEARRKFAEILDRVGRGKERIAVGDEGEPLAVLVPVEDLKRLENQAEEALREREEPLRLVIEGTTPKLAEQTLRLARFSMDHAADAIFWIGPDGSFSYVNETGRESLGYSAEEFAALRLRDIDPEVSEAGWPDIWQRIKDRSPYVFEARHRRKDGTGFAVEISIFHLCYGEMEFACCFSRDITKRKRAEEALREGEARLQAILDHSPVLTSVKNPEGRYLLANRKHQELSGRTLDEYRGKRPFDIFPADHADSAMANHRQVLETGEAVQCEETLKLEDGTHTYLTVKFPILDPSGKITSIGSISTDITERKRAEEEIRESEARFKDFAEGANDWAWEMDSDLRYTYVSPSYEHYSGVPAESIIGHTRPELYAQVLPELKAQEVEHWQEFNRLLEARQAFRSLEQRWVRPDGEVRYFLTSAKPVIDAQGGFVGYRGVGSDITDVRRRGEELREELERQVGERTAELRAAQAELLRQARLATLGQLTATVSHELRNPLGVIRTSAFVVRDGLAGAPSRVARSLERIERSVIRCDRIIDEMLDFTRISDLEIEATAIDSWLAGVLEEQELPRGPTLHFEFGLKGVRIGVDRNRLRRAVINVFDNACQAMIADGSERTENGEHRLTVRTGAAAGRIELVFEDTGAGIPSEVLPKVFEPLFSTKGFGVGLGLSVVHQIMGQHGGGIEIENRERGGARVCLWLPGDEPGP